MQERSFKKQAKVTILVSYLKIVCKCYCACTYACKYYNFWADLQFIAWKKLTHKCYWHLLNFLHRDKEVLISPLTERSSSLNQPQWFYAEIPQATRILSRHQPDLLHCIPKALSNWWLLLSFWKIRKYAPGDYCDLCGLRFLIPVWSPMRSCSFQGKSLTSHCAREPSAVDGGDAQLTPLNFHFKRTALASDFTWVFFPVCHVSCDLLHFTHTCLSV